MAYVDWKLKLNRLSACSCDYGCPCEFNARPTRSPCEGTEAFEVAEGYFGDLRLDGLRVISIYRWPGAVHEGGGITQGIIDQRATEAQREALFTILSGKEQEPNTMFNIYGSTIEKEFDPVFTPIEFEWDIKARTGRYAAEGICEASFMPIRNPVTNAEHHALIKLPQGFEFREALMVSSKFWTKGPITQDHNNRYGFLTISTFGPYGIIEEESYPLG
jgi:hypothetical protein